MSARYMDLDLLFEKIGPGYRVRVLGARVPATADFEDPGRAGERMRDLRPRRDEEAKPREAGEALFTAVFQGKVEGAYRQALQQARDKETGLRICLRLTEVPELEDLPWEAVYDPVKGQFLSLLPGVSVVRYRENDSSSFSRIEPPLRILAALASPQDAARLDVEREWRGIEAGLQDQCRSGLVAIDKLQPTTVPGLLASLEKETCHILHFVGHGLFDTEATNSQLVLEGPGGQSDPIDEHRLATALQRHGKVRLAVLNACHGARAHPGDAHSGLTRRLLQMGIPAVIAMRTKVGDRQAVYFASRFYRNLASGSSIEDAFSAARRDLFLRFSDASWTTPALSLSTTDPKVLELSLRERRQPPWRWFLVPVTILVLVALGFWQLLSPSNSDTASTTARLPNPPSCPSPEGLDLPMVLVHAGVQARDKDDTLVVEKDFCLGAYEVTQRQWQAALPEVTNPSGWLGDNRPVERVSRLDVELFLNALNERVIGNPFRLPTEAEWEYAARAGSPSTFSFGGNSEKIGLYGNCRSPNGQDGYDGTAPVGAFQPNEWGIYDMHGNVWEWVASYDNREESVLRGGSYDVLPGKCTASYRKLLSPEDRRKDYGFRVAREPLRAPQ